MPLAPACRTRNTNAHTTSGSDRYVACRNTVPIALHASLSVLLLRRPSGCCVAERSGRQSRKTSTHAAPSAVCSPLEGGAPSPPVASNRFVSRRARGAWGLPNLNVPASPVKRPEKTQMRGRKAGCRLPRFAAHAIPMPTQQAEATVMSYVEIRSLSLGGGMARVRTFARQATGALRTLDLCFAQTGFQFYTVNCGCAGWFSGIPDARKGV